MKRKPMIDVLLIPDVLPYFDPSMKALLKDGSYFHCSEIDTDGPYLKMTVQLPIPGGDKFLEALIAIPHNFVLCILTAPEKVKRTILGFEKNVSDNDNLSL